MKKLLCIFIFCVLIFDTYSQENIYEVQCKVINKSSYYTHSYVDYTYKGELKPGKIITALNVISCFWFPPENDEKFLIYFNKNKDEFCTFPQNIVPVETKMLFEQDILTDTTTFSFFIKRTRDEKKICKEMWVPIHYADVLKSLDRETLPEYEPRLLDYNRAGADAFYGTSEWYEIDEIYNGIKSGMIVFFNPIIYTRGGEFLIKTIEKYEYGYKVKCFVPLDINYKYSKTYRLMPYFNWALCTGETITMFLYIDGEYMDMYINETDDKHKFGTIIKVKEEFVRQFQNLIKNGECDLTNVLFPRRADGSTDYLPPELAADINHTQETENTYNSAIAELSTGNSAKTGLVFRVIMITGITLLLGGGVAVFIIKRRK